MTINMKKTKIFALVVALIVIGTILFSRNSPSSEKIKIGVIIPLTGHATTVVQDTTAIINEYAKTARNIEFVFQDDQCSGKNAISAYNMLKNQGIKIYSVSCSGSILALAPLVAQDGNVIITAFGGSTEIRKTGDEVIRFIPDGLSIAEGLVKEIKSNPDKRYGVLYENMDYAKSVVEKLQKDVPNQIISVDGYKTDETSFSTLIAKVNTSSADELIYIPVGEVSRELIYKEMQKMNFSKNILGEVNVCESQIFPEKFGLHGVCFKTELKTDGYKKFVDEFKNKYGRDLTYPFYNSITYDMLKNADDILEGVSIQKDDAIRNFKDKILSGIDGEISSYRFSPEGEVLDGEYLVRVEF